MDDTRESAVEGIQPKLDGIRLGLIRNLVTTVDRIYAVSYAALVVFLFRIRKEPSCEVIQLEAAQRGRSKDIFLDPLTTARPVQHTPEQGVVAAEVLRTLSLQSWSSGACLLDQPAWTGSSKHCAFLGEFLRYEVNSPLLDLFSTGFG